MPRRCAGPRQRCTFRRAASRSALGHARPGTGWRQRSARCPGMASDPSLPTAARGDSTATARAQDGWR